MRGRSVLFGIFIVIFHRDPISAVNSSVKAAARSAADRNRISESSVSVANGFWASMARSSRTAISRLARACRHQIQCGQLIRSGGRVSRRLPDRRRA
jgi:hypothetical protein